MKKKTTAYFLKHIGRLRETEWFDCADGEHLFSQKYELEKEKLLRSLEKHPGRGAKRGAAVAAAALALTMTATAGVYAAVSMFRVDVTETEGTDQVKVRVEKDGEGQILPIKITANYLPEGYQEWEEGKYSLNGVFGGTGLSITDGGWCADWNETVEYILNDVSDVETLQVGDAQGVLIHREGYDYPYRMDLYYGDSGHVIIVDASREISREELLKVCENLTYTELTDSVETVTAYQFDAGENGGSFLGSTDGEEEAGETYVEAIPAGQVKKLNESFADGYGFADAVQLKVTDIRVTDTVDVDKLTEETTGDYASVMEHLDGTTLKPYQRTVSEWKDKKLVERVLDTVHVKNVEVTVEVTNSGDENLDDVNMQPRWDRYTAGQDGAFVLDESIPGYEETGASRGGSRYDIQADNFAYYFDSSAYGGSTHFYNMALDAGETRTVHLWFAIPEDELGNSYLQFNEGSDLENRVLVKIIQ